MYRTLLALLIPVMLGCQNESEKEGAIIEVPLEIEAGYGPFEGSFSYFSPEHTLDNPGGAPWVPTYRPVSGIPKDWTSVVKSMVWLNGFQLVYQNFHEGKISRKMFEGLKESWKWEPDEQSYSRKPLKCFVYVVRGIDKAGRTALMIDTDNDLDFSDETAFYPEKIRKIGKNARDLVSNAEKTWMVQYEYFRRGKIVKDTLPMIVRHAVDYEAQYSFLYSFPRHARATFTWKGKDYPIYLDNYFDRANFDEAKVFTENELKQGRRSAFANGVEKGELIELGSLLNKSKFRNLGINPRTGSLRLQSESADLDEYSLQKGYAMRPFEAKDFKTGEKITLADFRGKYVFIDFWGTWCGPCVAQLPELREIHKKVNPNQVQFIGIVGEDTEKRLTNFLSKNDLDWPQILSDSVNKLVETYNINSYPTTILLGPDGRVVDRNIHGEALKNRLKAISAGLVL